MEHLLYEIGRVCGILGFFFLSFLIFSGDTARYWNKLIGLDKIIKFQKKFSYFTAVFVILHPVFFALSYKSPKGFFIPDFAYIPLALGILAFYVFIAIMIASALYKRISYKIWQYIHVLTYVLFFFALYHAKEWGSTKNLLIPYIITLLFIICGIIYRTQYKIRNSKVNKFIVDSIQHETHDTFTLVLSSENKLKFKAGQFCFLRINKNKLYARHPFTISSAPHENKLSFTIKIAGRFTKTARDLQTGESVFVDGPFGNFIPNEDKDMVFIAGGVGITPFMSILKDRVHKNLAQKITLFYGSKTEDDIIFRKDLENMNYDWLQKVYLINNIVNLKMECEQGYIREDLIKKYVKNTTGSMYYICGPEGMKETAKKVLKEMGVPKSNTFVEDFFW